MNKMTEIKNVKTAIEAKTGIRNQLLFGFAIVVFIFIISVAYTIYKVNATEKYAKEFYEIDIPVSHKLIELQGDLINVQLHVTNMIINKSVDYKNENLKEEWAKIDALSANVSNLIAKTNDVGLKQRWERIQTLFAKIKDTSAKLVDLSVTGNVDAAIQIYKTDFIPVRFEINDAFNLNGETGSEKVGILENLSDIVLLGMTKILQDIGMIKISVSILLLISIIVSMLIALFTANRIVEPLRNAINIAKRVASGERNVEILISTKDETAELLSALGVMQESIYESERQLQAKAAETRELFESIVRAANLFSEHTSRVAAGDLTKRLSTTEQDINHKIMLQLGNDLNKMTDNLSSISNEITQACHNMVSTLEEVRHSVDAQSSGATEQASSINEITASISEIEKSAAQTMSKAQALGEVAERTREKGQLGLDAVEQSIQGMKTVRDKVQIIAQTILDLSKQTQQVGEITSVVNNLAQQSKMLALNASIEAAKAGEAGKGFAVVASEVKNLAEQSEQSTSQVQKILEDIKQATEKAVMVTEEGTKGVDNGMSLIEQTGDIIRSLNDVIHETSIATQQIEAAVRQEGSGIEQINAGMNEINQVTASFVESVQQTTEAMNDLVTISKKLKVSVDTYKI